MEVKLTVRSERTYIIDTDLDPPLDRKGLVVERHEKSGLIRWPIPAALPSRGRSDCGGFASSDIQGSILRTGKQRLNAIVLDYLLKNADLIPNEWKGKYVVFWGTVYRDAEGLYVRCLHWCEDGWSWFYSWLDENGRSTTLERHPHIDL
jgi:hypothetical protein